MQLLGMNSQSRMDDREPQPMEQRHRGPSGLDPDGEILADGPKTV